jgi:hypothetical protein
VRGGVERAAVGFGFDDARRAVIGGDEDLVEQVRCDFARVAAIEIARQDRACRGELCTRAASRQRNDLATATTFSTVKPKCGINASIGADAPKRSMPTTPPSRPTYLRQKSVTPASIATRLRQALGSTDSR